MHSIVLKQFKGHNITATRYHFVLVGNDYEQTYQIIDTRSGRVLYHNDDENKCLENLIQLSTVDSYNSKIIEGFC